MVLGDEPELGVRAPVNVVGRDEAEHILVPQTPRPVHAALVLPRPLVCRAERLHGHQLAAPPALVHLAETALEKTRKSFEFALH